MARELTREEKRAIRALVTKWCANYDRECGCLPLDCECYMLGKCWTGAYCRYFREAVLPLDPALEVSLLSEGPRPDFKEMFYLLWNALNSLPEVQGRRVDAYLILGKTYRQIAREEGVDKCAVRRSVKSGITHMKKYLRKNF